MTFRLAVAALAALFAFHSPAVAANTAAAADATKRLGKFGTWESFTYGDGAAKTCYLAAAAGKVVGGEKGKTTTYLIVTHRPGSKGQDEISLNGTYGFKKDSEVEFQIGATKFALFTRGDRAWARDAATDKAIIASMRKGKDASLRAIPAKGANLSATVALSGFSDALAAADKACGIKR
ncbi:invasion associated locus B family protein [Magnetospirillum molischianum]|uniref:Invasion associated locus B (IalB) protein n=1 Tax=Magnetospirillum molischianum DSM 120 TaxID=1150626 RepID=H8FW24_MAGML|nr:invasion associated locus B family protein [Magnetospirillum molischianum]CCG42562.1 conserved exported hypothetical protein [Magnetospirillum molischianum DSM 120]